MMANERKPRRIRGANLYADAYNVSLRLHEQWLDDVDRRSRYGYSESLTADEAQEVVAATLALADVIHLLSNSPDQQEAYSQAFNKHMDALDAQSAEILLENDHLRENSK